MEIAHGYQKTDVGVIPVDWSLARIGEFAVKVGSGITPTGGNRVYKASGRPFVRSQNVGWGILALDDLAYIDEETHQSFPETELRRNDVLLNITGASIGRCAVSDERLVGGNVNQHVCIIRSNSSLTDSRFVHATLLSSIGQKQIESFQAGGNREGLNFSQVKSIRIPLPPTKAEQEAIAEALSDADRLIESLERLIAKKRQLKQAAMQELLTGKRRLPGFSGGWTMKSLGEIVDTDPENLGSETRPDYAFNYISLEDVDCGTMRSYSEQVFRSAPSRARRKLRPNDVLVSTVRPNLRSHLLFEKTQGNWVCSTGFCVIRCRAGVSHPSFVFAHMFSDGVSRQIDALLTGSNYPAINSRDVRVLQVPTPDFNEQIGIAAALGDMEREITLHETKLDKARHVKQGMMQNLLTGKIRLV